MTYKLYGVLAALLVLLAVVIFGIFKILQSDYSDISVVIAPHHNVVAEERYQLLEAVSQKMKAPPQTIILMSPNHYAVGSQSIQIYEGELTSEYGSLNTDSEVIDIVELLGGTVENNNFYREHGIRVMLPDLRRAFPDVPIVPLMVSDRISQNRIDEFTTQLHSQCDQCLLIASADMSHYQPYELSELHDRLTIRELMERDRSSFTDDKQLAEVGPPHIMSAALLWAELSDHQQFDLFMHTNSVAIDKTYYAEGTTHVMGWYQKGDQQQPENRVSFTLAGDIMFDGAIADNYQDSGFVEAFGLFGDRVLWGTDLVAANLEGPITDKPKLEAAGDAPRFAFNPSAITALHYLHFNALNIQNNHSLDAGEAGLADTKDHLRSAGIEAVDFGNEPFIVEGRGLKLATFFVDVQTDNSAVVESIKRWSADSNIRVLVFAHWGLERQAKHGPIQEAAAHAWIDAGADLVVGTGPHVIQDAEVYQGKPIIYSLGNILFDQVEKPETAQSLILAGEFTQDGLTLLPMLTKQQGLQPVLQRSSEADNEIMERLGELKPFEVDGYGGVRLEFNHIQ